MIAGADCPHRCRRRLTAARASLSIAAMADTTRITRITRQTQIEHATREERLARALRENLRRRKEQARAREPKAGNGPDRAAVGDETAG